MTDRRQAGMDDILVTRRHLLAAWALAAVTVGGLTGCDDEGVVADADRSLHPRVHAADTLLAELLISDKERLLHRYAETTAAHPDLATALRPFVRRHERHVEAVAAAAPLSAQPSAPAPGEWATPSAWPSPPGEPPAAALGSLADAEADASTRRSPLVLSARSGRLAAIIASIAACESGHAILLRELAE